MHSIWEVRNVEVGNEWQQVVGTTGLPGALNSLTIGLRLNDAVRLGDLMAKCFFLGQK